MIKFEKLPKNIQIKIPELRRFLETDSNVIFAYIFGSLAKEKIQPLSDIDIAIYTKDTADIANYKLRLFDKVTKILGTNELDLVILNNAPISLVGRILQNNLILVDKQPFLRHSYESVALRKFFDFKVKEDTLFSLRYKVDR